MVCWHSELFPLLLLIMLTNHKGLSQLSKCDYSSSPNNIINIKIALTKGLKNLTPFHTKTMEECMNKCCSGLFITEGYPCNVMTFAHSKMPSSPNCYLFYCSNKDACPMIPLDGYISYVIKNDQPNGKTLDLSVEKSHFQNREESSDNGILKDFQNVVSDLPSRQRSPILSRTTTLLPVTSIQSRTTQSRVASILQEPTSSTLTTSSTLPVATTQLRATSTSPVITEKSTAITALLNNFSLTSVKTVPTIIFPITQSTRTTALPSTLPVTSNKLTRTSLQTTVLTNMDQAMTTITTKPLTTHTLQTTVQTTTTQPTTTTNLPTILRTTTQSTMTTPLLTTQQTTIQPTTISTLPTTLLTTTTSQPTTTSTLLTTVQTTTTSQPTTTSTLLTTLQTMTTSQPTTTSTLLTTVPTTTQPTTTITLPTTLWTSTTQPIMTTTLPNTQQTTTQPAIITTVVTNPQTNNHLSATITLPTTILRTTTTQTTTHLRKTQSITTILPTADLTTRKLVPNVTQQSTVSRIPVAKTSLFSIITVVSNNGNINKKDGEQNQRQNLGGLNKLAGKMGNSQMEVKGGLIAALLFGLLFLTIVVIILGKQMKDTFKRRHYTKMDFLMNGMYVDA